MKPYLDQEKPDNKKACDQSLSVSIYDLVEELLRESETAPGRQTKKK